MTEQREPTGPGGVRPPVPGRGQDMAGFARAEAVAGLAREVHDLSRAVQTLREVPGRVEQLGSRTEELGKVVGQLSEAVQALTRRPKAVPAPSWLLLPDDPQIVQRVLGELCSWLHAVFLRYPDGAAALPECWMRHPDVVEELLWLMHAWCAAYQGATASVALAGDWHDRQRPGVVRRIQRSAGSCSSEKHLTRPEWDQYPTGAVAVPGVDDTAELAAWWGARRDDPAPEPIAPESSTSGSGVVNGAHR
ncbi:hypothetical protein ACU61A_27235 [Pseudonocardia sichuanensis]